MRTAGLNWRKLNFTFPATAEPAWKTVIPRWNQLDAAAFVLAQAAFELKSLGRPDFLILASPGASNETDRAFTRSGALNPSKFAHTLPNIRCSPFCQILEWTGPALCVQKDPRTQQQALIEAFEINSEYKRVWILSHEGASAHFFDFSPEARQFRFYKAAAQGLTPEGAERADRDLLDWFENGEREFSMNNYIIEKRDNS